MDAMMRTIKEREGNKKNEITGFLRHFQHYFSYIAAVGDCTNLCVPSPLPPYIFILTH